MINASSGARRSCAIACRMSVQRMPKSKRVHVTLPRSVQRPLREVPKVTEHARRIRQAIAATPLPPAPTAPTESLANRQAYSTYSSSPSEPGRASVPHSGLDALAVGAFSEVAEMRATIAKLQDRLHGLEGILSGVFERTKQEETSPVMRNALPSSVSQEPWLATLPTELQGLSPQAHVQSTPLPYGAPSGLVSSAFSPTQPYNMPDLHNTTLSLPPLQEPFTSPPTAGTVELHHEAQDITQDAAYSGQSATTDPRWEKLREEEVAASLSLEFLVRSCFGLAGHGASADTALSLRPSDATIWTLAPQSYVSVHLSP